MSSCVEESWNDLVQIDEDAKGAMVLQAESKNSRMDVIR